MSGDPGELGSIDLARCDVRVSAGDRTLVLRRAFANQVDCGFCLPGQVGRRPVTVNVHLKDAWTLKEEMIVHRRDFESVIEEGGHDRIDLVFQKHQVAHHDVHSTVTLGHRKPASEAERRRGCDTVDGDFKVVPGNVDLQDVVFEIPLLARDFRTPSYSAGTAWPKASPASITIGIKRRVVITIALSLPIRVWARKLCYRSLAYR